MDKLNDFIYKRNFIADFYHEYFRNNEFFRCLGSGGLEKKDYYHAYHIFVIVLDLHKLNKVSKTRDTIFKELKEKGIGVNVHYMPIYLHPYYKSIGYEKGLCPVSENLYEGLITLPMFPLLSLLDLQYVCENVVKIIQ
jgi:dTDP-4-amino-4,6-dideoxygalactose transaminase